MKKATIVFLMIVIVAFSASAQSTSPFSLSVTPGAEIPLGPVTIDGTQLFTLGGSAVLAGEYTFPFAPLVYAKGQLGYGILPTAAQTTLSLLSFGGGIGLQFTPFSKATAKISVDGGYSLGIYQDEMAGVGYVSGEAKFLYSLTPSFGLGLGASYDHHFPFYSGIGVFLGVSFNLGAGRSRSNVDFMNIQLNPVFPVFYQYYDENSLGEVTIQNAENGPIKDVTVSFYVPQFMDKPKVCATIDEIKKGEDETVPLYALFRNNIMDLTEGTRVNSEIVVEYNYLDTAFATSTGETIQLHHRNAMTWDDDNKAASFITAKDPEILRFTKNIAGQLRTVGTKAVNTKFREAMALFEALKSYGINYVIDPTTPYIALSQDVFSLDYLQFPIQTMSYKAGDCDDLSILYSALLESIGIETAFITIPAHIYMAFGLDITPEAAKNEFVRLDDLIIIDDKVWVPVEITMVQDGFLKAWQTGAKEWRENNAAGTAAFYPVYDAWKTYPPVAITDPNAKVDDLDIESIVDAFVVNLEEFIEHEISGKVIELEEIIADSGNNPRYVNRLGVLYARYGLYDRAKIQFEHSANRDFPLSMINLANIYFIEEDYNRALRYYRMAEEEYPEKISVLIGIAKSHYELENHDSVRTVYNKIKALDPDTATKFAYLVSATGGTDRQLDVATKKAVLWDEEE